MQQLQVVQQQIQNQAYIPQLYNTQGQQLIMPGNIALHHGLNPQIQVTCLSSVLHACNMCMVLVVQVLINLLSQVIAAGKTFQQNQLTGQHMLSTGKN